GMISGIFMVKAVPNNWKMTGIWNFHGKVSPSAVNARDYNGMVDSLWQDTYTGNVYLWNGGTGNFGLVSPGMQSSWFNE
ncbi:MAG: hypothetical protein HQL03_16385, partial [Nitrospirae bacterium]|nr:hypothetical protein [Nitrospirota bacterium]